MMAVSQYRWLERYCTYYINRARSSRLFCKTGAVRTEKVINTINGRIEVGMLPEKDDEKF